MNLTSSDFSIGTFTDAHWYSRRVPTEGLLEGCTYLTDKFIHAGVKVIAITGDVFDRPVPVNTAEYSMIYDWIRKFLIKCRSHNIMVWVLEGTPSHDARQSKMFVEINESCEVGCNLHWVNTLEIRHFDELDLDVLFVPDELNPDSRTTYRQIQELMDMKGLSQVHLALTHGNYDHLIPPQLTRADTHQKADFEKIVTYYVLNGHIHIPKKAGKIINTGSVGRTAHNEEEDKGGYLINIFGHGSDMPTSTVTRIVNPHAVIFKTIDIRGMTTDQALVAVKPWLESPEGSNLRLHYKQGDPIVLGLLELFKQYPQFRWGTKVDKEERKLAKALATLEERYQGIEINPDSIHKLMEEQLKQRGHEESVGALLERLQTVL